MTGFIARVVVSFVVAGVWIGTATVIAERYGNKVGGLIGNLPSTVVVSFIFITLTQSLAYTVEAARAVPVGMAIDTVFILLFVLASRAGLAVAVAVSLAGWLSLAFAAEAIGLPAWWLGAALCVGSSVAAFLVMEKGLRLKTLGGQRVRYSAAQMVGRMVFAGAVVATSVILAHTAGPYWTGLFSTFPAVMLSTLVILYLARGRAFSAGTGKILALSAPNILVFAFVAASLYPRVGLVAGTVAGYLAAAVFILMLRSVVSRVA
ncbi:MAG: hypothetical protein WAW06_00065 [bacterium]